MNLNHNKSYIQQMKSKLLYKYLFRKKSSVFDFIICLVSIQKITI